MKTGEIYKWTTDKARGHENRPKYHLFIGKNEKKQNIFLFISSINYFNEGFELLNTDYPFFSKASSYIGCTSVVYYYDNEIDHLTDDDCLGVLTDAHLNALHMHISKSEVMEQRLIDFICAELKNALNN